MTIALTIVAIVSTTAYFILNAQVTAIRHCLDFTPSTCTSTPAEQTADQNWAGNYAFAGMMFGIPLGLAGWLAILYRRLALSSS